MPRVRIQGGSAQPFRVSANDVDADDTFALIFDGNQPPLRLQVRGVVNATRAAGLPWPVEFTQSGGTYPQIAGLSPLFALNAYNGPIAVDGAPSGAFGRNPFAQAVTPPPPATGFGGAVANGFFYGLNFTNLPSGTSSYLINYAIFKNQG